MIYTTHLSDNTELKNN